MEHPEQRPHGRGKRLTADARFRTELALCRQYRIPHSQFLGVGTGTWSEHDRAKALAYEEYLRSICPQCGTRESEWVDEQGNYVDAYIAITHKCHGCEEVALKQKEIPEQAAPGMKVLLLSPSVLAAQELVAQLSQHNQD